MKRYTIIVKVGKTEIQKEKFVKYRVSNILKFVSFLDKNFPTWRWANVFSTKTREQLGSFTCKNLPKKRFF